MVKKGHKNGQDQHLNQYPTMIYPAQMPYSTRQNQLHGDQRSPNCPEPPHHSANHTHPSLTLSCKHYKTLRSLMGRGSPRPTIKPRKSSSSSGCYNNAEHQTRKCLRDLCHPPGSRPKGLSLSIRAHHLPDSPNHTGDSQIWIATKGPASRIGLPFLLGLVSRWDIKVDPGGCF